MNNFTLQDVAGSVVGVVAFALVLYAPGYVLGYAANLFGFRRMNAREQAAWAIAYSFALTPWAGYLLAKFAGLNAACVLAMGLACVWGVLAWRDRRKLVWTPQATLVACAAAVWAGFAILSLVDWQVGHRLYFSVVLDDQGYRAAFTDAVLRTGVPPANPLYFPGHAQPMRYYYYWYVVCAMVARIGQVSARQAFIASSVWAGFGMAAVLGLFVRHFLGVVEGARRQMWIAVGLLAVTGADLLPAVGAWFAGGRLNGDMEWWSNDQISSWADSLLWVPHHLAAMLCCVVAFLLLWMSRKAVAVWDRRWAVGLAAIAFASSFGLSVYVAFGFAVLMLAWMLRLVAGRARDVRLALQVAAAGALSAVLLAPYVLELAGAASRLQAGAAQPHLFAFSVRRMIDPGFLTGLPVLAGWNSAHPVVVDGAARLLLLLPGLALELGVYGAVLWLYARQRRAYAVDSAQRTALFLAGWGLVLVLFVRSTAVFGNNDFGYRAALVPQFFLLLLAMDLLGGWRSGRGAAAVRKTRWRTRWIYGLLALGVAGTVYQVVMLRAFLPLEARQPGGEFAQLPAQAYAVRTAFAELQRTDGTSGAVEFNPIDPAGGASADAVTPYTFYALTNLIDAGRQILSAEANCGSRYGGVPGPCVALESATQRLYAKPALNADAAREYCARFGAEYLAVGEMDPVWGDAQGWAATLPVAASAEGFKVMRCGAGVR
jgi:hypothetical protein